MRMQCAGCFKRFELVLDNERSFEQGNSDSEREAIGCPWCGYNNGYTQKGSIIINRGSTGEDD